MTLKDRLEAIAPGVELPRTMALQIESIAHVSACIAAIMQILVAKGICTGEELTEQVAACREFVDKGIADKVVEIVQM